MNPARTPLNLRKGTAHLVKEAELHILCKEHTTESLAKALGVSSATAARAIDRLRKELAARGGGLVSVREGRTWHYEIRDAADFPRSWKDDPLVAAIGTLRGGVRAPERSLDGTVYDGR